MYIEIKKDQHFPVDLTAALDHLFNKALRNKYPRKIKLIIK